MRAFTIALSVISIAAPASAAFNASLAPGLNTPFTEDFRSLGTRSMLARDDTEYDFGPISATASGKGDERALVQSADGIAADRAPGGGGISPYRIDALEKVTLTFQHEYSLRSIGFTKALEELAQTGETNVTLAVNEGEFVTFLTDETNTSTDGETSLVYAGMDWAFQSGETLTFSSFNFQGYTIAGINGQVVPLPAAAWLFLGGLAGIGGYVRYGRRGADA